MNDYKKALRRFSIFAQIFIYSSVGLPPPHCLDREKPLSPWAHNQLILIRSLIRFSKSMELLDSPFRVNLESCCIFIYSSFCRGTLFCCFCSFSSCFRVMKLPSLFVGLFISVLIDLWHLRNINLKGTFVFVPIFSPVICFYLFIFTRKFNFVEFFRFLLRAHWATTKTGFLNKKSLKWAGKLSYEPT